MDKIITVSNFNKNFWEKQVIKWLDFEVSRGEIFAYLGINGSGKTTTIRTLLGIYQPTSWQLDIWWKPFDMDMSYKIWYLPEERWIYVNDKVIDILTYFCQLKWINYLESKKRALNYLERVWLIDKKNEKIKKLSSGQQQKIQLGVSLLHEPPLLILDEPMKWFDPLNRSLFIDIMLEMKKRGTTILFSSHQMEDVEKMADSVLILKDWKIGAYWKIESVKRSFWSNTIKVWYEWEFKKNSDLFEAIVQNNYAEITPKPNISEQIILKDLVISNLNIIKFDISQPSLNDIFIKINK